MLKTQGSLTISQAAKRLGWTRQWLHKVLTRLEEAEGLDLDRRRGRHGSKLDPEFIERLRGSAFRPGRHGGRRVKRGAEDHEL